MADLTIVIDEGLLRRARVRASEEGTSVSDVLGRFLEAWVESDDVVSPDRAVIRRVLDHARRNPGDSQGARYTREEAYEGRIAWPR